MANSILIIDQRESDRLLLQKTLRGLGVINPIQMLSSGQEALHYLQGVAPYSDRSSFPFPTVIFFDLKLPGVSGWDILEWLKANSVRRKARIFAYTESMSVSDVRRLYSLGADSYVAKPTTDVELLRLIYQFPGTWQFETGREPSREL